jgi:hypothetical protein
MTNDLDYIIDNKQTVDVFLYFDLKEQEFRVKLYEIYPKDIRYIYIKRFEVVLDLPNKSLFNNDRIGYLYIERDKMWSDMREKDFDIDKTRDSQSTKNWKRHQEIEAEVLFLKTQNSVAEAKTASSDHPAD